VLLWVDMKLVCLVLSLSVALGCGGNAVTAGAGAPNVGGASAMETGGGTQNVLTDCGRVAADLARETPKAESCTALVRLDFSSLQILGHTFVCGPYQATDIASARATSDAVNQQAATGPDPACDRAARVLRSMGVAAGRDGRRIPRPGSHRNPEGILRALNTSCS
jgi:hypothetical protein